MKRVVIIGAGPAGLYTAIKFKRAGIHEVLVYDPRAGSYTRPGHLNHDVFVQAEHGVGVRFWPGKSNHIKDLERHLYDLAKQTKVTIEKKRFVRLHQHDKTPGIVIVNEEGVEEIIETNFVFDCTGARREVILAVNQLSTEPPFKLETITDVPVENHMLAYVKLNERDEELLLSTMGTSSVAPYTRPPLTVAQSILKLRALGWNELKFPRCYGSPFGKGKVCLYLHAPNNLAKENYDLWFKTVIESYTGPIHYEHLSESKKYKSKPRFQTFKLKAECLNKVSHKTPGLPLVTALGDAQIDFDYALAHGIYDGMKRIDALFEHIEIIDGALLYLEADEYQTMLKGLLRLHKEEVINAAKGLRKRFILTLDIVSSMLTEAMTLTENHAEKEALALVLKETAARQSVERAKKACQDYQETNPHDRPIEGSITTLDAIHTDLLKALADLPMTFTAERAATIELLSALATHWKDIGNSLFKAKRIADAIGVYQKALSIYTLPGLEGYPLQELPVRSNLIIAYLNAKNYEDAITSAKLALTMYARCPMDAKPTAFYEKILFNLIKALCSKATELLAAGNRSQAQLLQLEAKENLATHRSDLSSSIHAQIIPLMAGLQEEMSRVEALENNTATSDAAESSLLRSSSNATEGIIVVGRSTEDVRAPGGAPIADSNSQALKSLGIFPKPPSQNVRAVTEVSESGCCFAPFY